MYLHPNNTHYTNILLASHGTTGACAAEQAALNLHLGQPPRLHHLIVVPDFWKDMLGDDWLNNAITQIRFGHYVESQLEREIQKTIQCVNQAAESRQIPYRFEVMLGKPTQCLLQLADSNRFDLVVIGSPRPKTHPGLNSRLEVEILQRTLSVPLLIIPFPPTDDRHLHSISSATIDAVT